MEARRNQLPPPKMRVDRQPKTLLAQKQGGIVKTVFSSVFCETAAGSRFFPVFSGQFLRPCGG